MERPKREGDAATAQPKDRLIQARVPRALEGAVKEEARRRRLTVSHLIRNVLEDTFDLVSAVVGEVDQLVSDSAQLAQQVGRNARRSQRGERRRRASARDPLAHVCAWNAVILNRDVECSKCGAAIAKGTEAYAGLSDEPGPRAWLCQPCVETLEPAAPSSRDPEVPASPGGRG